MKITFLRVFGGLLMSKVRLTVYVDKDDLDWAKQQEFNRYETSEGRMIANCAKELRRTFLRFVRK
jgi:hypothetical protein